MGVITGYDDDPTTSDDDKFLTVDSGGSTKLTPASNIKTYIGDGWIPAGDSWAYSSWNSTTGVGVIATNSGANTKYEIGNKVKFDQPTLGTKYGVIVATDTSEIDVKMNSGDALDNEAITSPHYSSTATPFGSGQIQTSQISSGSVTALQLASENSQFLVATPSGNSDTPTGGLADWGASTTASVPLWATKARVTLTITGAFAVTSAAQFQARLVFGSVNGTTINGFGAEDSSTTGRERQYIITDEISLSGTGSQTVKVQANRTSGTGAVRLSTAARLTYQITYHP